MKTFKNLKFKKLKRKNLEKEKFRTKNFDFLMHVLKTWNLTIFFSKPET